MAASKIGTFFFMTILLLLNAGCASNEEENVLMKFFKGQRNFPTYSETELANRWERILEKHQTIREGMTVEEVVKILGLPDSELATNSGPTWVLPEKGILQYSPGISTKPRHGQDIRVFHVHFDEHGKVLRTATNEGFITAAPPR